jgi:hypothetical protein
VLSPSLIDLPCSNLNNYAGRSTLPYHGITDKWFNAVRKKIVNPSRSLTLAVVSFFFLLLASSAPHRVHHLFENLPSSQAGDHETAPVAAASEGHEHGHDHHSGSESSDPGRSSAKSDCVAQSVAQNSHLSFHQPLKIAYHALKIKAQADPPVVAAYQLSRSPSSQRAPPPA